MRWIEVISRRTKYAEIPELPVGIAAPARGLASEAAGQHQVAGR